MIAFSYAAVQLTSWPPIDANQGLLCKWVRCRNLFLMKRQFSLCSSLGLKLIRTLLNNQLQPIRLICGTEY